MNDGKSTNATHAATAPHVKALEPGTLLLSLLVSAASAIICMQLISRLGFTPNTSIIGALIAMSLARLPFKGLKKFRSLDRQNLVQTMTSAAGFAAANCTLLSVAIFYAYGDLSLVIPMLLGSGIATLIGMYLVYSAYDSELFPASGSWPPGVATAQALIAGDEGGKKGRNLLYGILLGALGSSKLFSFPALGVNGLPMAGIGIAFIANVFAMIALALGLIVRGYFPFFSQFLAPLASTLGVELPKNLGTTYIPHGFMIGAGLVSLVQALMIIFKSKPAEKAVEISASENYTVSPSALKKTLVVHTVLFAAGAVILAVLSGLWSEMDAAKLALWIVWCTFSAIVAPILVGLSAMHSGWFPGFAVSVIFLSLGIFMHFPPHALILLSGYVASTGPCFADMGYDLKTGWILRGRGTNPAYELDGRRQQVISELIGGIVAVVVTALIMNMHFKLDMVPPVSKVFAATIKAGLHPDILKQLSIAGIFGALLQFAGGAKKAIGILFATGLLINNPVYGIGLLAALLIRWPLEKKYKEELEIYGGGFVAGDGIYGFINALIRSFS
ncbi:MAG: OPT/YSL family transporter [Synergistaceae bacterium]|nr:OPT/YSL family transporter [Synergistaceae bacterium]